jgi:hypothetical protein
MQENGGCQQRPIATLRSQNRHGVAPYPPQMSEIMRSIMGRIRLSDHEAEQGTGEFAMRGKG